MPHGVLLTCPLCRDSAMRARVPSRAMYQIECEACGVFKVGVGLPGRVWKRLGRKGRELLDGLPFYIRKENQEHRVPEISAANWRQYAEQGRRVMQGNGLG